MADLHLHLISKNQKRTDYTFLRQFNNLLVSNTFALSNLWRLPLLLLLSCCYLWISSHVTHHMTMQDHLGGAGSQCVPWVPVQLQGEWGLVQDQLAQTEAALRAEQHSCELLREEAEESKGCAVQAQVQLEISHSRAERLAALVNQANQQRKRCV